MGQIIARREIGMNVGGRLTAAFKDGPMVKYVDVMPDNSLEVRTFEGNVLYTERALVGEHDLAIRSLDVETSSQDGRLVFIVGGFTAGTGNSLRLVVKADIKVAPRMDYGDDDNTLDDVP
jgi:hypothetical protein